MDGDGHTPPPPLPPLSLRPPTETSSVSPLSLQLYHPPATPIATVPTTPIATVPTTPIATVASTSSPSSSHHRRKRSKLTRVGTEGTASTSTPTRTPVRKPDPNAPKITRPCTECGKTFWSWKALFGHMRCHPERQWRGINPPPHLRRSPPLALPPPPPPPTTSEDDREVATSLLLLGSSPHVVGGPHIGSVPTRFECSSCKKTFPTHQALGGHRASHKNVKGCFAITRGSGVEEEGSSFVMEGYNSNFSGNIEMGHRFGPGSSSGSGLGMGLGMGMDLTHRCGICYKVFTSGQALGGHMRCHGERNEEASTTSSIGVGLGLGLGPVAQVAEAQMGIDLNLPAQEEDTGPPVCSTTSSSSSSMQLDLRLGI